MTMASEPMCGAEAAGVLRMVRVGGFRLVVSPGVGDGLIERVLESLPEGEGRGYAMVTGDSGVEAFVKVYNRRGKHGIRRRIKHGRSVREGEGYVRFAAAGIVTPRVLVWGEERVRGLWERGVIATELIHRRTVAEAYSRDGDASEIDSAARSLAGIHGKGLVHGDARTRNFFAGSEVAMAFDLCSWGSLTKGKRRRDVVVLAGSAIALTSDEEAGRRVIEVYTTASAAWDGGGDGIIADAIGYAEREGCA